MREEIDQLKARRVAIPSSKGFKVEKAITIMQPPDVLFSFWRNLENLPRFMLHLESVTMTDQNNSLWIAKGPAGSTLEWEAEIIEEKPGRMISWRSLSGSSVASAGSVWFRPAPGARGTEVRVVLKYAPRGGALTLALLKLMGDDPADQIEEDLHRLKAFLETGEIPTAQGELQ
ncbi:MAG: SRPBCC family protein [Bdellovibrionia bacterium]